MSAFFSVTIDALLSGDEVLTIAEEDRRQKKSRLRDLVFGALDCSAALFLLLPFFGQTADGAVQAVSLLLLTEVAPYLKTLYLIVVIALTALGIVTLALQNCCRPIWTKAKHRLSLLLHAAGTLLFVVSSQPYAAAFLFVFLAIKVLLLIKWH